MIGKNCSGKSTSRVKTKQRPIEAQTAVRFFLESNSLLQRWWYIRNASFSLILLLWSGAPQCCNSVGTATESCTVIGKSRRLQQSLQSPKLIKNEIPVPVARLVCCKYI